MNAMHPDFKKIKSPVNITPFKQTISPYDSNIIESKSINTTKQETRPFSRLQTVAENYVGIASVAFAPPCYQQCVQLVQNTPDDFQLIS